MGKRKAGIKLPPRVPYTILRAIIGFFLRIFFGYSVIIDDDIPKSGPLMVLGTHEGMYDFIFMAAAVRTRYLNYITTDRFFRSPKLAALLSFFGVIPRSQFHPDPGSIANILRILKQGGAIALYPAGQTSMAGAPGVIGPAIAKLLKKCGAPVVTVNMNGSFFTKPRFSAGSINPGKVECRIRKLYSAGQLAELSDEAVYRGIIDALDYNAYEWQRASGAKYRGRKRANGYHEILYLCPKCGAHHAMADKGNRLWCKECGNAAIVGRDMLMRPETPDCVVYPTMLEWYTAQEKLVIDETERDDFLLEVRTRVALFSGKLYHAGEGILRMDRERMWYEGTLNGERGELSVRHAVLPGLAADTSGYMEVYDSKAGVVRYLPEDVTVITKWKIAQEYLYSRTIDAENTVGRKTT